MCRTPLDKPPVPIDLEKEVAVLEAESSQTPTARSNASGEDIFETPTPNNLQIHSQQTVTENPESNGPVSQFRVNYGLGFQNAIQNEQKARFIFFVHHMKCYNYF